MSLQGSLRRVLDSFAAGARTVDELSDRSGLAPDLVRVALDQLVALGMLTSEAVSAGACPPAGCGGCPGPDTPGCARPSRGALVTLTIGPRAPD